MKQKGICPECKKEIIILWRSFNGMRLITEKNDKYFFEAKCPECSYEWDIEQSE